MSKPILLNGNYNTNGVQWSFGLGLLFLVIAGVVAGSSRNGKMDWEPIVILSVIGGISCIAMLGLLFLQKRKRSTLELIPDGFILTDRFGTVEYNDHQVAALGLLVTPYYSNGVMSGRTREAEIVILDADGPRRVPVKQYLSLKKEDLAGPWFDKQLDRLATLARSDFDGGRPLLGVGWRLERSGFYLGESDPLPIEQIQAVNVVDGEVRIWELDQENYSIALPAKTMNAYLLVQLLDEEIAKRPKRTVTEGSGLGRLIFERDISINSIIFWLGSLVAVLFMLGGVGAIMDNKVGRPGDPPKEVLGAAFIIGGLLAIFFMWRLRRRKFCCYERGVRFIRRKKVNELRYDQIGIFTYAATRQYHNGAYVGTSLVMEFIPYSDVDSPKIKFSKTIRNADAEIDDLRDFISNQLAGRMEKRVAAGQPVDWANGIAFHPEGLFCPKIPAGLLKKAAGTIPYESLEKYDMNNGYFSIYAEGQKKAITSLATSVPNFFPGFFLFMQLAGKKQSAATPFDRPGEPEPSDVEF
jgi:hypothetical protein